MAHYSRRVASFGGAGDKSVTAFALARRRGEQKKEPARGRLVGVSPYHICSCLGWLIVIC